MKAFQFAQVSTMDEYVKVVESFIKQSFKEKSRLGFRIHDVNGDGRICPNDVFHIVKNGKEFAHLGTFDQMTLIEELMRKKPCDIQEPGFLLRELEADFKAQWEVKEKELDKMRQEAYKIFGDRLDIDTSKRGRGSAARSLSPQRNTEGAESPSKMSNSKLSGFSPLRRGTLGSQETEGSVRMSDGSSNFGDTVSNSRSITTHGLIMGGD